MPTRFATLCCLSLVVASCGAPGGPALSDAERATIERDVRATVDRFAETERARDADAAVAFLDPEFYMYGDGVRAAYEEVVQQIQAALPTLQRFDTTWSDIEVTVLDRNHALVSMVFHDDVVDAEGAAIRQWGATTFVWRRAEGAWRLIYVDADHYPDEGAGG